MDRTLYTYNSRKLEIDFGWIPGLGFCIGCEPNYKEIVIIFACFILTVEFKRPVKKKRK